MYSPSLALTRSHPSRATSTRRQARPQLRLDVGGSFARRERASANHSPRANENDPPDFFLDSSVRFGNEANTSSSSWQPASLRMRVVDYYLPRSHTLRLTMQMEDGSRDEAPPSVVVPPFDDDDADIIVKSSDGHEFRLYRVILAKASLVFKDMFQLPQSPIAAKTVDPPEVIDGLPVVYLTEDKRTIELLLSHCYPMEHPELNSLEDVHRVLEAAIKYDMEIIANRARKAWPTAAAHDPFRAFAMACRMRWEEEAHVAARLTLQKSSWPLEPPLAPEFKGVSADTIVRLISYHRKCGAAAISCVNNPEWTTHVFDTAWCTHCQGTTIGTSYALRLRDWYTKYVRRAASALLAQPAGCTVLDPGFVNKSICDVCPAPSCEATSHCMDRIQRIATLFADEVDKAIAKIALDLDL